MVVIFSHLVTGSLSGSRVILESPIGVLNAQAQKRGQIVSVSTGLQPRKRPGRPRSLPHLVKHASSTTFPLLPKPQRRQEWKGLQETCAAREHRFVLDLLVGISWVSLFLCWNFWHLLVSWCGSWHGTATMTATHTATRAPTREQGPGLPISRGARFYSATTTIPLRNTKGVSTSLSSSPVGAIAGSNELP